MTKFWDWMTNPYRSRVARNELGQTPWDTVCLVTPLIVLFVVLLFAAGCKIRTIDDGGWDHGYDPKVHQDRHSKD